MWRLSVGGAGVRKRRTALQFCALCGLLVASLDSWWHHWTLGGITGLLVASLDSWWHHWRVVCWLQWACKALQMRWLAAAVDALRKSRCSIPCLLSWADASLLVCAAMCTGQRQPPPGCMPNWCLCCRRLL